MGLPRLNHLELLADDFASIFELSASRWSELDGSEILLTGGTGFFGSWICHSLLWAMKNSRHRFKVNVLCRDPKRFLDECPYFKDSPHFSFFAHDISRPLDTAIGADYIVHAATPASAQLNQEAPMVMIDTIVSGTRNILEYAARVKPKNFLFISSGAVYGKIEYGIPIAETNLQAPDTMQPLNAYGEAKRLAELLCAIYSKTYGFKQSSLRCFAFVGPFMAFNQHFAIGNFIEDSIRQRPILIKGDDRTMRSYMYGSDMVRAVVSLLVLAPGGEAINVGSDQAISIGQLATSIRDVLHSDSELSFAENRSLPEKIDWYIPDISRLRLKYQVAPVMSLEQSVRATGAWLRKVQSKQNTVIH